MNNKSSVKGDGGRPLVSVLVPIFNVEKFLDQCLSSLKAQTLENIEFICLNDGSTDSSPEIIKKYIKLDKRFKILDKKNSGYGDSMNQGLAMAKGKYIGIVESDDWAEPNMFEDLTRLAEKNNADAVKSNFYFYSSKNGGSSKKFAVVHSDETNMVINPRRTPYIFRGMSTIWSGLYNRQFLIDNKINFLPTPGASYQDTGFNFKVWAAATRVVCTNKAYLHYRIDNEQSSVKSRAKVFCVCDEFESIKDYLLKNNLMEQLKPVYTQRKFDIYFWNLTRLDGDNLRDFTIRMSKEFKDDIDNGYFDLSFCNNKERSIIQSIIDNPTRFLYRKKLRKIVGKVARVLRRVTNNLNRNYIKRRNTINNLNGVIELNNNTIQAIEQQKQLSKCAVNDNKNVSISIIVPIYNASSTISDTINSLVNQTFDDIEIICIDDGSTDDSLKIIKQLAKNDNRIKVYHQKNAGVATARNHGLEKATGKYIMWCDSDDQYTPNMCLRMLNIMEQRNVDIAICSQNVIDDKIEKELKKDVAKYLEHKYKGEQLINWQLIANTDVSLWNKIFRRDIIVNNKLRFPDGLLFEDAYFCNTYMLYSKTAYYSSDKLYNYVRQSNGIMSTSFRKNKSSADYLKITMATYKFFKDRGLYDQYANLFLLRLIQDFSYVYDNQDKLGRLNAKSFVYNFIANNFEDFSKADDGMQKAVDKIIEHPKRGTMINKFKNSLVIFRQKTSRGFRQRLMILNLSNEIAAQARYLEYLADTPYER